MVGKRKVSVFGSTGSIGCNTLNVLHTQGGAGAFDVVALTGGGNIDLLAEQARRFRPDVVVTAYDDSLDDLKARLSDTDIHVAAGKTALLEAAKRPTDWCMAAVSGAAGVEVAYAALDNTRTMGLATKECLVCAGPLFLQKARDNNVTLIPVDSEHNAIYQVFPFDQPDSVDKLILTASGGPFRTWTLDQMRAATPQDALKHPTWSMGQHISIDSATMFNKAMEMIEAYHLFDVRSDQIDVVVHPESIIHSMVACRDGSILAQMGVSDMCIPIAYALNWPARVLDASKALDFTQLSQLTFEQPDRTRFCALDIARNLMNDSGGGCVLNAAKEVAVTAFLQNRIGFLSIEQTIISALETLDYTQNVSTIDDMIALDQTTRAFAERTIGHT